MEATPPHTTLEGIGRMDAWITPHTVTATRAPGMLKVTGRPPQTGGRIEKKGRQIIV